MCNPLAIAALAAGAGSQAYGQGQVQRASDNAMQRGMEAQRALQGNINDVVMQGANRDFEVGNMANEYTKSGDERTGTLMDVLKNYGTQEQQPNDSKDVFSMAQAKAKTSQIEAATKLAALMGKAGALGDAGQKRQINMMGDADQVAGIGQDMRRAQQQTQWDLDKAQQKGDTAKLLGSLLMSGAVMTNPTGGGFSAFGAKNVSGSGAAANNMFGALA